MAKVVKRENETTEQLIKRFKKAVINEGIIEDYRKKEFYLAPSLKRKLKHEAALKRERKLQQKFIINNNDY